MYIKITVYYKIYEFFCFFLRSFSSSFKASRTMKLVLLCLVLISTNQGFFIPPKSSCIFANNCQEQSLEETVQEHPIIRIKGHQPKVKALSYYHYPLPRKFVLKQIIDKMLKLRNAIVAKPFRSTISRII